MSSGVKFGEEVAGGGSVVQRQEGGWDRVQGLSGSGRREG